MSSHGSVICIVGPTASGKSSLSELVAKKLETSVISVDAMQVYRGMDIGTAKTPVEEREVPLLMVDCANISEEYSVQMFQTAAREAAHKLIKAGKTPVFCGGTGLYLDSIIDQMEFPSGSIESPVRTRYEKLAEELGAGGLHDLLATKDAASAVLIHPNNVRRVVRALELLEEVQALIESGLSENCTAGQAIGYKEFFAYFAGEQSLEQTRELIKQHTRQYAKRQISWLKRDGRVRWLDMDRLTPEDALELIFAQRSDVQCQ